MKNILCITAHPDDDSLFAGTLLKMKTAGWNIFEAILTGGEDGVSIKNDVKNLKKHRVTEAEQFAKLIGLSDIYWLNGTDGFLEETKQITEELVRVMRKVNPSILILLSPGDYHKDHQVSYKIGLSAIELATRNAYLSLGKSIETPLILVSDGINLLAEPQIIVNTTVEHPTRMEALRQAYASQMDADLDRFSEGVALARGARIKTIYGEGFNLAKISSRPLLTEKNMMALTDLLKM